MMDLNNSKNIHYRYKYLLRINIILNELNYRLLENYDY